MTTEQLPLDDEIAPDGEAAETGILREYLLVSDTNSKVVLSSQDYNEVRKLASRIRACGGQVTLFKALKA